MIYKNNLKKAFTIAEMIVVFSFILGIVYLYQNIFFQKGLEIQLKNELNKVEILIDKYVFNSNIGYVSGLNSYCGNLSFNDISAYRIDYCIGDGTKSINSRFFLDGNTSGCNNTNVTDQNNGMCSYFESNFGVAFQLYIDEDSSNSDIIHLYFESLSDEDRENALFEQYGYGYIANKFSSILMNENRNAIKNSHTVMDDIISETTGTLNDGSFSLSLKKL